MVGTKDETYGIKDMGCGLLQGIKDQLRDIRDLKCGLHRLTLGVRD